MSADTEKLRAEMAVERQLDREFRAELVVTDDLDLYLRGAIGIKPPEFMKALHRAAPFTLNMTRAFVTGFLCARSSSITEAEITRVAEMAYAAMPWRRAA